MKIKLFEEYTPSYWAFEDDKLKIHKILHGVNKGKIWFHFFNDASDLYDNKTSMIYGCFLILGTKYENNENIREITLGPEKFRKVYENSLRAIFNYCHKGENINDEKIRNFLKKEFSSEIEKIPENASNLGEVIDELKKVKYKIDVYLVSKKYNL